MRKWLLLLPVMFLTASAMPVVGQSAAPSAPPTTPPYLVPGRIESIDLIPPPPPAGSDRQRADLEAVLAVQGSRTPVLSARAQEDRPNLTAFTTVLGPKLTDKIVPKTAAFLAKARGETGGQVDRVKDCWERPRPFVVSRDVKPLGTMAEDMAIKPDEVIENMAPHGASWPCKPAEKPAYSYSYPSGASNAGTTMAILLAAMVPEKRGELFARALELGENRVIAGVHFPTDVESGRILATALVAVMMQNPVFRADLAAAKAELRAALDLPVSKE